METSKITKFGLDYETRSDIDLKATGAFRYAEGEHAAILLAAISKDDQPVRLWDVFASPADNAPALDWLRELAGDPNAVVSAFNAPFEVAITRTLWKKTFGFSPPLLHQWRCTQALCRIASIPSSLEKAAEFLNLSIQKDKVGSSLIQKFSIPQKDGSFLTPAHDKPLTVAGTKMSAAEAWTLFRKYAIKDVETERELGHRLRSLEIKGWTLESFQLDMRMNTLGVPINRESVATAIKLVDDYSEIAAEKFRAITGVNPSQTAKVLAWMKERGYPADNMQVGTVDEVLDAPEGLTDDAIEALTIKSMIGYAALKKLPTMLRAACSDGRIRGMFKWAGAKTGRYSSGIVQMQNLKRSTSISEGCYEMIRSGNIEAADIEILFGSPLQVVSTAIRHFVDPGEGRMFLDVDLSQIEVRVLAWLAGHEELLQTFRDGKDLYKATIAAVLGIEYSQVSKDQRQTAKALTLACGYAGGLNAMDAACKMYGMVLTEKEKRGLIKAWRKANKPITELWSKIGEAATDAILNPGTWVAANDKVRFGVTGSLGYRELIMELPSKRKLHYPYPELKRIYKIKRLRAGITPANLHELEEGDDGREWVEIPKHHAVDAEGNTYDGVWATYEMSYYGPFKASTQWGRVRTHPGVLVENLSQAVAGDFLNYGAICADKQGYDIVMTVHDQLITEYHPERGNTVEGLVSALCTLPAWADRMPLDAVGGITPFYTKD